MRPDPKARPEYIAAFRELVNRIGSSLAGLPKQALPIRMYLAGGAALHMYTGERVSRDIDATFSHRIALPENLEVAYRDADGAARLLYFDRQYNDMFGLLHEDARDDSVPLAIPGIDAGVLEVRLLCALDLAVSKLGRFSSQDRDDIAALARHKLISSAKLRQRAEEALVGYIGDTTRAQGSIELAVRIVADIETRAGKGHKPK
ncbi:MAG: nucleotidyl transferase AbiEii/AbiGii toxin family protein [Steroidobacteraceae bacterium]